MAATPNEARTPRWAWTWTTRTTTIEGAVENIESCKKCTAKLNQRWFNNKIQQWFKNKNTIEWKKYKFVEFQQPIKQFEFCKFQYTLSMNMIWICWEGKKDDLFFFCELKKSKLTTSTMNWCINFIFVYHGNKLLWHIGNTVLGGTWLGGVGWGWGGGEFCFCKILEWTCKGVLQSSL